METEVEKVQRKRWRRTNRNEAPDFCFVLNRRLIGSATVGEISGV